MSELRLGFHYHIPAVGRDGAIWMPGYLALFVDSIAKWLHHVTCFQHSPIGSEADRCDTPLGSPNVDLVSLGPHFSMPRRIVLGSSYRRRVLASTSRFDAFMIRGPSPLLPNLGHAIHGQGVPLALLLVGDYVRGVGGLHQPEWKKALVWMLAALNRRGQDLLAKKALVFVNNAELLREYQRRAARVVEIVRDPRDVVASRKTRRATVWAPDRYRPEVRRMKHLLVAHHPVWDSLAWKAAISATGALGSRAVGQVLRVRYEDLVLRPEHEVASICTFLGMKFAPEMTAVRERNPADHHAEQAESITAASMARWKRVLTPAEVLVVQTLTRSEMERLGYPAVPVTLRARGISVFVWCSAVFEAIRRLDRRRRARGVGFVARQVRGYLRRAVLLVAAMFSRSRRAADRIEVRR